MLKLSLVPVSWNSAPPQKKKKKKKCIGVTWLTQGFKNMKKEEKLPITMVFLTIMQTKLQKLQSW